VKSVDCERDEGDRERAEDNGALTCIWRTIDKQNVKAGDGKEQLKCAFHAPFHVEQSAPEEQGEQNAETCQGHHRKRRFTARNQVNGDFA
jgi:hypothetical protein